MKNAIVSSDFSYQKHFREAPMFFFYIAFNLVIPNVIDFLSVGGFFLILFIIDFLGEHLCCYFAV